MVAADDVVTALLEAGLDLASVLPLSDAEDRTLRAWIAAGHHGAMRYLERHLPAREDPKSAFPHYRSVAIAALEYGEVASPSSDPAVGNISRYALGDDYHLVMKARLGRAADHLRKLDPGLRTRILVDASPLNEKLLAARAGLGWVGKNTNLLQAGRGSYLFLGALLLSAECAGEPRPAAKNRCGRCTACLDVCPTKAFIGPYQLDARRCISYLTIELDGPIPIDLREGIGNRIFGCDDCQEVCPWNRFARKITPAPFLPKPGRRTRGLVDWLHLTLEDFESEFRGTALERTGHRRFLRNVLVAMGCTHSAEVGAHAVPFLGHDDPLLRGHAAWAVGACRPAHGEAALESALAVESDPWAQEEEQLARRNLVGG